MERLSWDQIKVRYDKQWVHLIDFDWEEGMPYPSSGTVHVHANSRREFNKLIMENDPVSGARIFVGDVKEKEDMLGMGCLVVNKNAIN